MYPIVGKQDNTVVRKQEAGELTEFFYDCEIIQAVYTQIDTHLFINGLTITPSKGAKDDIDTILQESMKKDWTSFARKAVAHLIMYGYCVVLGSEEIFERGGKPYTSPIPVLVPREMYDLEMRYTKDFKVEYKAKVNGLEYQENKRNIMVFTMNGKEPDTETGTHRSILKTLYPLYKHTKSLVYYNDLALRQRAHPPIFVEAENAILNAEQPHVKTTFDIKTNKRVVNHEAMLPELCLLPDAQLSKRKDGNRKYTSFVQFHRDNMIEIPRGLVLCSSGAPKPEPPPDLLPALDSYRDKVFSLFGIPATVAFAQLSTRNGTSSAIDLDDSDAVKLNKSLKVFQDMILDILGDIFYSLFPDEKRKYKIKLMIYSPLSITQALTLDSMDMIGRDVTKKLVVQRVGLDDDYIFEGENDHSRPIPGQNELFTTDLMIARANEINAKAEQLRADAKCKKAQADGINKEGYHPPKTSQ